MDNQKQLKMTSISQEYSSTNSIIPIVQYDEKKHPPRKLPQYVASVAAMLGILSGGLVVGWTSPAGEHGVNLRTYPFEMRPDEFSWVSSVFNIGAAVICIPIGMLADVFGRRKIILTLIIPCTVGWACVIWPNCVGTLIFGRLLLGAGAGSFFVIAPMYSAEIADKETRGRLCSYFDLFGCTGILAAYTLGLLDDMFLLSLICATVPVISFFIFFFMPESPTFFVKKGNFAAARKSLVWLRGSHYNVDSELAEEIDCQAQATGSGKEEISFFVAIRSRAAVKGLIIGFGLMFFQQLSGINAILYYAGGIFSKATGEDAAWPTIVVGVMQVAAAFLSGLVVDKWGRKPLLAISGTAMSLTTLILGLFFYLDREENGAMDDFRWLPLACLCGFVVFSSFGFGSIPVTMSGELFSPQIKGISMSGAMLFNRLMAFVVTKCYSDANAAVGSYGTFWIFSVICAISVAFVVLVVPETKGKTLEQIQILLSRDEANKERTKQSEKTKM